MKDEIEDKIRYILEDVRQNKVDITPVLKKILLLENNMKIGQKVKVINKNLSRYGECGTVIKEKVSTILCEMTVVKFSEGDGAFRNGSLEIQKQEK